MSDTNTTTTSEAQPQSAPADTQSSDLESKLAAEAARRDAAPPPKTPKDDFKAEVAELRKELNALKEDRKKQEIQNVWADEQQRLRGWMGKHGPDKFPTLSRLGDEGADMVHRQVKAIWQQTGKVPRDEDAASQVEEYLAGLAAKLVPSSNGAEDKAKKAESKTTQTPTNDDTSEVYDRVSTQQLMSDDEQLQLMASMLKFKESK